MAAAAALANANNILATKNKVGQLVAELEKMSGTSSKRPHKCLMCAQPYGTCETNYLASLITAKCCHSGYGSSCCETSRGVTGSRCISEPACGLTPEKYDCYECRRKTRTSTCLLCNQPYGHNPAINQLQITAKCGHSGGGEWCSQARIDATNRILDVYACHIDPVTTNCYACRQT